MKTGIEFDKRLIKHGGPPKGFDEHLKTLRCCCCGERGGVCGCRIVAGKIVKGEKAKVLGAISNNDPLGLLPGGH